MIRRSEAAVRKHPHHYLENTFQNTKCLNAALAGNTMSGLSGPGRSQAQRTEPESGETDVDVFLFLQFIRRIRKTTQAEHLPGGILSLNVHRTGQMDPWVSVTPFTWPDSSRQSKNRTIAQSGSSETNGYEGTWWWCGWSPVSSQTKRTQTCCSVSACELAFITMGGEKYTIYTTAGVPAPPGLVPRDVVLGGLPGCHVLPWGVL